ncbi:thiamine diphosphokinase [Texcoconibacillus texcoconensis]|uniref:Thiamine diphosphokinase n=1 Tax=Texcoconibacillus texcoconensis TaxID=1095777 RepID=A0A840QL82_9BACI|nr:thiamine diphosphokinase [Texcoconibacillus texcoconensis]MBB5172123.1 thiamine pyrophosphokinase [Texcoconibacillus texcoconensis]
MEYIVVAGGPISHMPRFTEVKKRYPNANWVGVDRGAYHIVEAGIELLQAFGDFDSLSEDERDVLSLHTVKRDVYPREKDRTDLDIALNWVVQQNPTSVTILGATGGRLDHFMVNIHLLTKHDYVKHQIVIEDVNNRVRVEQPGTYCLPNSGRYRYVSFIPLTDVVSGLTLDGFYYPLNDEQIIRTSSLTISNEWKEDKGFFSFTDGILTVIESRD